MAAKLSGGGGGRYNVDQNAEINVTPFVDVMLVLLIIFMVAAPLATVSVEVALPTAVAPVSPPPQSPVFVSIQRDGRLYIGDYDAELETLGADIRKTLIGRDPEKERIFIRADSEVPYQEFMRVLNNLQDSGFYSVALVGEEARD